MQYITKYSDPDKESCTKALDFSPPVSVYEASAAWHHLAVTWTAGNGTFKVYKDGLLFNEVRRWAAAASGLNQSSASTFKVYKDGLLFNEVRHVIWTRAAGNCTVKVYEDGLLFNEVLCWAAAACHLSRSSAMSSCLPSDKARLDLLLGQQAGMLLNTPSGLCRVTGCSLHMERMGIECTS